MTSQCKPIRSTGTAPISSCCKTLLRDRLYAIQPMQTMRKKPDLDLLTSGSVHTEVLSWTKGLPSLVSIVPAIFLLQHGQTNRQTGATKCFIPRRGLYNQCGIIKLKAKVRNSTVAADTRNQWWANHNHITKAQINWQKDLNHVPNHKSNDNSRVKMSNYIMNQNNWQNIT